ncbi:hypothetical protein [Paenibacillus ginsengarvi]|uniref:Translation elongation factor EFTu/EF1A C-terminal domain-containing protein n=1 Tax=Paenibacillus ginsengarvi TaxID=400777 RepID=A0A3B0BD11_9BACL|nr:hypothetical protein [Paenibacillus ginsengarvi]RKN70650.1 hypothetical protein D7M11_29870 [Paenibacillus ginsengarvi]
MLSLEAEVLLFNGQDGGMKVDGFSGMMASFSVKGELIACKILSKSGDKKIMRGTKNSVIIQLPYGENYKEHITQNYEFKLNHGGHVFGEGRVLNVL